MNKFQIQWFSLIIAFFLPQWGCISTDTVDSNKVDASEIYQSYIVSYSEDTGMLSSSATFRVGGSGGTTLDLASPSTVKFDNQDTNKSTFLGTSYQTSFTQTFTANHQWTYIDRDGKVYTNSATITPVQLDQPPTSISKSKDAVILLSGSPAGPNETIYGEISVPSADGSTYASSLTATSSSQNVIFQAVQLAKLKTGAGSLQFFRRKYSSLQNGTAKGGYIDAGYSTKKVNLQITD